MNKYYLDTSIWLDFFEARGINGKSVKKMMNNLSQENSIIICSEVVFNELLKIGYSKSDLRESFYPIKNYIKFVYSKKEQFGKAKQISQKRKLPLFDVFHSIIARDNKAILMSIN